MQAMHQVKAATRRSYEEWLADFSFLAIDKPHLRVWLSEYAHPYFNIVIYSNLDNEQQACEAISEVVTQAKERNVPLSWRVVSGVMPDYLPALLREHGFTKEEKSVVMAHFFDDNAMASIFNEDVSIKAIIESGQMQRWLDVVCEQYTNDPIFKDVYCKVLMQKKLLKDGTVHYGAYDQDKLIATGSLTIDGYAGDISNIATALEYQKRGIASAMIAFLLDKAKGAGAHLVMLSAYQDLIPFYNKRGFQELFEIQDFIYYP